MGRAEFCVATAECGYDRTYAKLPPHMKAPGAGIACIGAAHVDRIARCQEAFAWRASNPVTLTASSGGVARNVALNLARLARPAKLLSVLGGDRDGEALIAELRSHRVDCQHAAQLEGRATASYTALLDSAGELLCGLADADIYEALTPEWLERVAPDLADWPLWAIDANLSESGIGALAAQKADGVRLAALAVSPAKAPRLKPHLASFDMLFANRAEAAALLGQQVETLAEAEDAAVALRALGPGLVFVTLGDAGVAVAAARGCELYPAPVTDVVNVNGAGDGFAAGVLDALLAAAPLTDAVRRGLAAARLTAQSPDTCSAEISAARLDQS